MEFGGRKSHSEGTTMDLEAYTLYTICRRVYDLGDLNGEPGILARLGVLVQELLQAFSVLLQRDHVQIVDVDLVSRPIEVEVVAHGTFPAGVRVPPARGKRSATNPSAAGCSRGR